MVTTSIAASEAKAKFSELLERAQKGESFSITLHGKEAAHLVPARRSTRAEIQEVISEMKATRIRLNPPGKTKLRIRELIAEGRP